MAGGGSQLRLVRLDMYRYPAGGIVLSTPRGKMFRVAAGEDEIVSVLASRDGLGALNGHSAKRSDQAGFAELLQALRVEGSLSELPSFPGERDWARFETALAAPPTMDLVVVGSERLLALVCTDILSGRFRSIICLSTVADLSTLSRHDVLVLVLLDYFDQKTLFEVNALCRAIGVRWTHFHFERETGWFGPHVEPGKGPDFADLYARRLAAAADPLVLQALSEPISTGERYLPPEPELIWMLSTLLVDLERWIAGAPAHGRWHEVAVDPVRLKINTHPVLPLPDPAGSASPADAVVADPTRLLVDERCGIVKQLRKVQHHPSIPSSLITVHAQVADVSRISPWRNDTVAGGSTFGDRAAAENAALGEAIERYCGNIIQEDQLIKASFDQLVAQGKRAIDPETLVLYSDDQYAAPGFPFVPLTRELEIYWLRGHSLTANEPTWIPACLVYANWYRHTFAHEVKTNGTFFPGLAAGRTLESAVIAGIQEIIERHATMVWWLNQHELPAIRPTVELASVWPTPSGDGIHRYWLIHLDNEFSVPVMAGVVEDSHDQLLTIGFAARANAADAARKAWTEALTLQDIGRDLLDRDGAYRRAMAAGQVNGNCLKPWRPDRRYLDDYREDFRDVADLICQIQIHLDPRAHDIVRPWVETPADRALNDLPRLDDTRLEKFQAAVEKQGHEIFYADVTTPDVKRAGMSVVRTIIPGMVPNSPSAFPFLGRHAVQDAPVRLGWTTAPPAEDDLNYFPMPHA